MPTLTQGILAALAIFAALVLILWLPPHQRRRKRTHGTHVATRPALLPEYVPLSGGVIPHRGPGAGSQGTPHPPIHVHITHHDAHPVGCGHSYLPTTRMADQPDTTTHVTTPTHPISPRLRATPAPPWVGVPPPLGDPLPAPPLTRHDT